HLQRAGATTDEDAVIASFEHGARGAAARTATRLPDLERLPLQNGARPRRGPERAQLALDFRATRRPVDLFVLLAELARVGCAGLRLRRRPRCARERFDDRSCAERGELVVQAAEIVVRRDRQPMLREHWPGIQTRIHLHDADASL